MTKKAISNPNEPIKANLKRSGSPDKSGLEKRTKSTGIAGRPERSRRIAYQNEPNFFAAKYAFPNQKQRIGGQPEGQKNETNPILTNA